jgi:acetolactate synthase small subunit
MTKIGHTRYEENSVSKTVANILGNDEYLSDAIRKGYGNYSAIARLIKPLVEEQLKKSVKAEGVISAVKRVRLNVSDFSKDVVKIITGSTINVRTDVAKVSLEKTRKTINTIREILLKYKEEFLQVSESMRSATLIFDQKIFHEVCSSFKDSDILEKKQNLAAIIVQSPEEIVETPGCISHFYSNISRKGVNIEDTTSCFTDTIMVVKMEDSGRAFLSLTDLIHKTRKGIRRNI